METKFRDMLEIESIVVDELLSREYPRDSIIMEGQLNARRFVDFIVVDINTGLPLMIIEVKSCSQRTYDFVEQAAFKDLRKYYNSCNIPVKAIAAIYNREETKLEFIDFTEAIKEDDFSRKINNYTPPKYSDLTIGAKQKAIKKQEIKQNNSINILKHLCWWILPLIGIVILVLDAQGIYTLSVLRLIVIGAIGAITLIPCFKEITIGEVSIKQLSEDVVTKDKMKG